MQNESSANQYSVEEIIKRVMFAKQFTKFQQVADFLEVDAKTLSAWKQRNSPSAIEKILYRCGKEINGEWLLTGDGSMVPSPLDSSSSTSPLDLIAGIRKHPNPPAISEDEMVKHVYAQMASVLKIMPPRIKGSTLDYLREIAPEWPHKNEVSEMGLESHSKEMYRKVRILGWKDEGLERFASLGFGDAKTMQDYLDWKITNAELYEKSREEARVAKKVIDEHVNDAGTDK